MRPVRIRHRSHHSATQSSHLVDRAGWQAKMASIEFWMPWRNAHWPHCRSFHTRKYFRRLRLRTFVRKFSHSKGGVTYTGMCITFRCFYYYRKCGSASYIVREVRSVRERERYREREREREWDGSDVTLVALKLAMNFAPFLAKSFHLSIGEEFALFLAKICTSVSPLLKLKGAEFTLSVAKNAALFETVRVLRFASVKWRDRGSKPRNKRSNFRLHRPSSHRKNESD